jgi:predicted RNase H-like HicB family nuclease
MYPSEDIAGQWIVHCLELDVVTQGDSAENAVQMLDDALNILAYENMKDGRPPFEFRSAPPEDWELYRRAEPIGTHLLRIKGDVFSDDVTLAPSVVRASWGPRPHPRTGTTRCDGTALSGRKLAWGSQEGRP